MQQQVCAAASFSRYFPPASPLPRSISLSLIFFFFYPSAGGSDEFYSRAELLTATRSRSRIGPFSRAAELIRFTFDRLLRSGERARRVNELRLVRCLSLFHKMRRVPHRLCRSVLISIREMAEEPAGRKCRVKRALRRATVACNAAMRPLPASRVTLSPVTTRWGWTTLGRVHR